MSDNTERNKKNNHILWTWLDSGQENTSEGLEFISAKLCFSSSFPTFEVLKDAEGTKEPKDVRLGLISFQVFPSWWTRSDCTRHQCIISVKTLVESQPEKTRRCSPFQSFYPDAVRSVFCCCCFFNRAYEGELRQISATFKSELTPTFPRCFPSSSPLMICFSSWIFGSEPSDHILLSLTHRSEQISGIYSSLLCSRHSLLQDVETFWQFVSRMLSLSCSYRMTRCTHRYEGGWSVDGEESFSWCTDVSLKHFRVHYADTSRLSEQVRPSLEDFMIHG